MKVYFLHQVFVSAQSEFTTLKNIDKLKRQCVALKRYCLYCVYILLCIFHVKMQALMKNMPIIWKEFYV